jgi:hypothetical protein
MKLMKFIQAVISSIIYKIKSIYHGWTNMVDKPTFFEPEAAKRASECSKCPYKKLGVCTKCYCPTAAKVWSFEESCPDGRWDSVDEQGLLQLIDDELDVDGE